MCDNYRNTDTSDWWQYHPTLQSMWRSQITAYKPIIIRYQSGNKVFYKGYKPEDVGRTVDFSQQKQIIEEGYTNWENPNRLRAWK